jgi:hypothetical protein
MTCDEVLEWLNEPRNVAQRGQRAENGHREDLYKLDLPAENLLTQTRVKAQTPKYTTQPRTNSDL